jgi:tRNA A-37 threonylcarbamoyl transferase component Bud32
MPLPMRRIGYSCFAAAAFFAVVTFVLLIVSAVLANTARRNLHAMERPSSGVEVGTSPTTWQSFDDASRSITATRDLIVATTVIAVLVIPTLVAGVLAHRKAERDKIFDPELPETGIIELEQEPDDSDDSHHDASMRRRAIRKAVVQNPLLLQSYTSNPAAAASRATDSFEEPECALRDDFEIERNTRQSKGHGGWRSPPTPLIRPTYRGAASLVSTALPDTNELSRSVVVVQAHRDQSPENMTGLPRPEHVEESEDEGQPTEMFNSPLVRAATSSRLVPFPAAARNDSGPSFSAQDSLTQTPTGCQEPAEAWNLVTDPYRSVIICSRLNVTSVHAVSAEVLRTFHFRMHAVARQLHAKARKVGMMCIITRREADCVVLALRRGDTALSPSAQLDYRTVCSLLDTVLSITDDPMDRSEHLMRVVALHVGFLSCLAGPTKTRIFSGACIDDTISLSMCAPMIHCACIATEAFVAEFNLRHTFAEAETPVDAAVALPIDFLHPDLNLGAHAYDVFIESLDHAGNQRGLSSWADHFSEFVKCVRDGGLESAEKMAENLITDGSSPISVRPHVSRLMDQARLRRGQWQYTHVGPHWRCEDAVELSLEGGPQHNRVSRGLASMSTWTNADGGANTFTTRGREMLRKSITQSRLTKVASARRCSLSPVAAMRPAGDFPSAAAATNLSHERSASRSGGGHPLRQVISEASLDGSMNGSAPRHTAERHLSQGALLHRRDTANHGTMIMRELESALMRDKMSVAVGDGVVPDDFSDGALSEDGDDGVTAPPTRVVDQWGTVWSRSGHLLGQGATANVFLGMHDGTGELVAVKCVPLAFFADDSETVKAFGSEVRTLTRLKHRNIVAYRSFAVTDNGWAIVVIEYVSGGTLASITGSFGALPEAVVVRYMFDVLRGLAFLHSQGILHRDIKPQNVLVGLDGTCKLGDFGTAHSPADGEQESGVVRGSPLYMAPEQARGQAEMASDIWAAGLLAVTMLTGDLPYADIRNAEAHALVFQIGMGTIRPVVTGSDAMREVLTLCFGAEPASRPTAEALLAHSIFTEAAKKAAARRDKTNEGKHHRGVTKSRSTLRESGVELLDVQSPHLRTASPSSFAPSSPGTGDLSPHEEM